VSDLPNVLASLPIKLYCPTLQPSCRLKWIYCFITQAHSSGGVRFSPACVCLFAVIEHRGRKVILQSRRSFCLRCRPIN